MKRTSNVHWSFDIKVFVRGYAIGEQINYELLEPKDQKKLQKSDLVRWEEVDTLIICRRVK